MLTVNDLMTVDPITISPDTTLSRIIVLMKKEGCRQLPVIDEGKLVGLVTDRDVRLVLNSPLVAQDTRGEEAFLEKIIAEGFMTVTLVTVTPDTPAYKAAEMLSIYKFGALPVVEGESLVGIVTVTDFLDLLWAGRPEMASGHPSLRTLNEENHIDIDAVHASVPGRGGVLSEIDTGG